MSFILAATATSAPPITAFIPCCLPLIPMVGMLLVILLFVVVGLAAKAFWIWMLVDACTNPALAKNNDRIIWFLVIFFVPIMGAIIYFFVARKPKS